MAGNVVFGLEWISTGVGEIESVVLCWLGGGRVVFDDFHVDALEVCGYGEVWWGNGF